MKKYFTIKEACALAHVSRWTLHRWISRGAVRAVRDGNDKSSPIFVDAETLLAFLAGKAEM